MKRINLKKGFTLIELMIVVAIIGILAAIAIPNFIRYQLRSKSAEAKTVMGGLKTSQESFRAEYDQYVMEAASNPGFTERGFKTAWVTTVCPDTCNRVSISATGSAGNCTTWECIGYRPAGDVYYEYVADIVEAPAGVPEWVACASADLDTDTVLGAFMFGTANDAASSGLATIDVAPCSATGPGTCVLGVSPGSMVVDCDPQNY